MYHLRRAQPAVLAAMRSQRSQTRRFSAGPAMSCHEPDTVIPYDKIAQKSDKARQELDRPLTYAEKVIYGHLDESVSAGDIVKGDTYINLRPDRVACQDASAPGAVLQFISSGLARTAVPATIHCDHLVVAKENDKKDLEVAIETYGEVFNFLESAAAKYGLGFWRPGSGIIHQIVLENYAFPGGLMIGTDSHTPNAGGLGMVAVGVGGADAVDAMANLPWEVKAPKIIGVKLTGKLDPWSSPKDVILKVASLLTTRGGTGHVLEYFGPGVQTLSATGMGTICNMGAEVGATTSLFPFTASMGDYLRSTNREDIANAADTYTELLSADEGAEYDEIVEINLSELAPHLNGPFTPDRGNTLDSIRGSIESENWPVPVSASLIGSCTNSSYHDLARAASLCQQAIDAGLELQSDFYVTPGSEQIRATIKRDGITDTFEKLGAKMLASACGPCVGQWDRVDKQGERNTIVSSYNRNFVGRQDRNKDTHNFLTSPELATVLAIAGRLDFDPRTDSVTTPEGKEFRFKIPTGDELPKQGFDAGENTLQSCPTLEEAKDLKINIPEGSTRLQLLEPFNAWDKQDIPNAKVLIKVKGKCTTDNISMAGRWMAYRGHLDNISENTLIGAVNAENDDHDNVLNATTGEWGTVPGTARDYKAKGIPWVVIGDANYGEGSAREHAALQPRHLGGRAVIARSFARIHETNLKKQGMLPLTFSDPADYDKVSGHDSVALLGLTDMTPGQPLTLKVFKENGSEIELLVQHSFNDNQIGWFKAGSALNMMRARDQMK